MLVIFDIWNCSVRRLLLVSSINSTHGCTRVLMVFDGQDLRVVSYLTAAGSWEALKTTVLCVVVIYRL